MTRYIAVTNSASCKPKLVSPTTNPTTSSMMTRYRECPPLRLRWQDTENAWRTTRWVWEATRWMVVTSSWLPEKKVHSTRWNALLVTVTVTSTARRLTITIINHHQKFSPIINNNSRLILIIIVIDLDNHHIIKTTFSFASCFKWWSRFGEDVVAAAAGFRSGRSVFK